jgi:geranylgeranylglycerol-phosphate geranylgeranyltransferase
MGWTVANEVVDIEVDRVNKPWKPLPSGQVGLKKAVSLSLISIITSICTLIVLVQTTGNPIYLLGFIGHIFSLWYNLFDRGIVGNTFMGCTYGIAALMSLYPKHILFALAFTAITISFNMMVQYQDLKAEKTKGRRVAPEQLGEVGTSVFTIALSILCVLLLCEMYLETSYPPLLPFIAIPSIVMTTAVFIVLPISERTKHIVVENGERRLGRLLMLLGFLWMLFQS